MVSDVIQFPQRQSQQELSWLEVLATLSYRSGELSHYLHKIVGEVSSLLHADWSVVAIYRNGTGEILASSLDLGEENHGLFICNILTGQVIKDGQLLVIEDIQINSETVTLLDDYRAYISVPLRTLEGTCIGTLCLLFHQPQQFTAAAIYLTEIFAERAATAIENYQLYQQQQCIQVLEAEIRERQQTEEKLMHLAEIGELAAMIVHEIRNPLTTVLLGLMAFQNMELSEATQERLGLALEEAERLKRLLNEILVYTKSQVLQTCELEVNQFITELLSSIRNLPAAAGRSIEFVSSLPAAWIRGDRDKLKQVFINLLRNACEAIDEGESVIWQIAFGETMHQVCITVHNRGTPISPEILTKLGTPFFTTKLSGNGLGLAIVKQIIAAHQGEWKIESNPEHGTTVSVYLPLVRSDIIQDTDASLDNI